MYACTLYECAHAPIQMHTHLRVCVNMPVYVCMCFYACMHICVCVCVWACVDMLGTKTICLATTRLAHTNRIGTNTYTFARRQRHITEVAKH